MKADRVACLTLLGGVLQIILDIANASCPETRTIPIPPRPGGVETATIVSSVLNIFTRKSSAVRIFYHSGNAPLLSNR